MLSYCFTTQRTFNGWFAIMILKKDEINNLLDRVICKLSNIYKANWEACWCWNKWHNKYGVKSFISHHQQVFEMFQQAYIEGISNYTVKVAWVPRILIISLIVCYFKLWFGIKTVRKNVYIFADYIKKNRGK